MNRGLKVGVESAPQGLLLDVAGFDPMNRGLKVICFKGPAKVKYKCCRI